VGGAGACGLDADDWSEMASPADEVGVSSFTSALEVDPCRPNACGANKAELDGTVVWQLALQEAGTTKGPGIASAHRRDGAPMLLRLAPEGDRLIGVSPETGDVIAERADLDGTKIQVRVSGKSYKIFIRRVAPAEQRFWAGAQLPIETYDFMYRPPSGGPERPLCAAGRERPSMIHAIVLGDEHYDPTTQQIGEGSTRRNRIDLACAESPMYQQHRSGYTAVAQARLGVSKTLAQRQAMLNAWTSNVCGTGVLFTRPGEPLVVRDGRGVFGAPSHAGAKQSREAIWDEHGAVCLDVHRLEQDVPQIRGLLKQACGHALPGPCEGLPGAWTDHGLVMTSNP
jgi:hypothetical protein